MFIKNSIHVKCIKKCLYNLKENSTLLTLLFNFIHILNNSEITFDLEPANAKQFTFGVLSLIKLSHRSCKKKKEEKK